MSEREIPERAPRALAERAERAGREPSSRGEGGARVLSHLHGPALVGMGQHRFAVSDTGPSSLGEKKAPPVDE